MFATGLGDVNNPPATGTLASGQPMKTLPNVTVGGKTALVNFGGLAPGFAGLYQVNFTVPAGLGVATVPVVVQTGLAISNTVTISVK